MTVSTRSEKKPIVPQTIRLRIEKFQALMDSDKSDTYWSEGVSSELVPQAIWKLKVMIYPKDDAEKRRGSISIELCRTGPMVDDERNLYASFYLYLIDRLGIRIDVGKRDSCNLRKMGYGWGWDISRDVVKSALRADESLLVGANISVHALYDDVGDTGRGVEEAIHEARYLRGDKIQRQPSDNSPSVSPTDEALFDSSTEAWAPSGDETHRHSSVNSPSVSYSRKTSPDPSIEISGQGFPGYTPRLLWAFQFEKRSIDKVLNAGNVVAMAVLVESYSSDKLMESCTELIACEGNTVFECADWKELEGIKPKLAVDLAFGAAALANTHSAERIKEICIGLITRHWRTVYKTAVWRELRETKPQFALDLAEQATRVLAEEVTRMLAKKK